MFASKHSSVRNTHFCVTIAAAIAASIVVMSASTSLNAQLLYSVGATNSPSGLELADIKSALPFSDGRIALLDAKESALYLISRDGKRFKRTGRKGQGPGEFESPIKIESDASNNLIVFDSRLSRFTWFRVAGDSLVFKTSSNIKENIQDFCVIANRLYAVTRVGKPVSVYDISKSSLIKIDSLGEGNLRHALVTHPMVRSFSQAGPIGCGDVRREVLWHSSQLDAGQVISIGGSQHALRLPEFLEVAMTPIDGGIRNSMPKGGALELVQGILPAEGSKYFIVSEVRRAAPGVAGYRVRVANTSGIVSQPTDANARLHSYRHGIAVCQPLDEEPQVYVVRSAPDANRYPCGTEVLSKPS